MGRFVFVLLGCLVLLSMSFISADVPATVFVDNSPPYVIANISDIFLVAGEDAINLIDLDDYFGEDNGEDWNVTFTSINNVTITVDSEHRVSFYPDAGYIGQQSLQFFVEDSMAKVEGNWFQLTVGQDTAAPRWSNPQKNRVTVYQNYNINFTTQWTDNVGLESFIFSINQGSGWVNSSSTLFSGTSNISRVKTKISASPLTTVYWKFYATDMYGNTNVTDTQSFTVREFDFTGEESSDGDSDGDGSDSDGSVGGTSQATSTPSGMVTSNFKTDTNNLKLSLRQGDAITKIIKITNTGGTTLDFSSELFTLNNFIIISDKIFSLAPGETKELLIDFKIPKDTMPDQYFGSIIIEAGEEIEIPIVLDVRKFDAEISLTVFISEKYKTVKPGKEVIATVSVVSLRDVRESNIELFYAIKDFKGAIIETKNRATKLFSSFEEQINLTVPHDVVDGEYLLYVRATGEDGIVDIGSDTFFVGARFRLLKFLEKFLFPLLFLLLIFLILLLIYIYRKSEKKKKALELYVMLNELRSLVKQGKTTEAVQVYKRIKVTYGQHVSSNFQKDKETLKLELDKFASLLKQNPIKPAASATVAKPVSKATTQKTKPVAPAKSTVAVAPTTIPPAKPVAPKAPAKPVAPKAPAKPMVAVAPKIIPQVKPVASTGSSKSPLEKIMSKKSSPIKKPAKPVAPAKLKPKVKKDAK